MIAAFSNTDLYLLVIVFVLLVVLVFLAVAEMALSQMTKPKAAALASDGLRSARALQRLVKEPERWINPLLLTVNICQTVQATLTGIVAGNAFGAFGVVIGVLLNVILFFVLAEAVPKTYAVLYPERAALLTARPTLWLSRFAPLQLISRFLIGLTNVIVRGKGLEKGPFVSEQELLGIVEAAADDEVIEPEERQLIESIIEFGDTVAREVMTPRPDVVVIDHDADVTAALDLALAHGYSRLPVAAAGEEDDIVGVTYTKDLMRAEREGRGTRPVTDFLHEVRFIPENKPVSRLMREMQAEKFHLAIVADEYGAIAGIITLEDCIEELVGEITDEHDTKGNGVEQLADDVWLVDGGTSISEMNDLLRAELPDEEWDTVGGFIFGTLEHVPEAGESIVHECWQFTTMEMEGRRVRQVRVSLVPGAHRPTVYEYDEDDDG